MARLSALGVLLLIAAGAALDLYRLGSPSLWYDEAVSFAFARLPLHALMPALRHMDAFFGLYYVLLHVVTLVSVREAALRLPSALAAIGFAIAVTRLGARLGGPRAMLITAGLASLSPLVIASAKEARPYSLLLLFSTLMTLAFLRFLDEPARLEWYVAYAALCIIGCYLHLFAALVVVSHAVWALFYRRTLPARFGWRYPLALAVIVVALVPLVVAIMAPGNVNVWIQRPTLRDVVMLAAQFAGAYAALVVEIVVLAVAISIAIRRHVQREIVFLAFLVVLPPLLAFGVSFAKPVFVGRYLFEAYPAFIVLVSIAIARLPRLAGLGACALILATSVRPILRTFQAIEDWRGAVSYVESHARTGAAVVLYPSFEAPSYAYYAPNRRLVTIPDGAPVTRFLGRDWVVTADQFATHPTLKIPRDADEFRGRIAVKPPHKRYP
ncbi:MAG: hypothetical protein JWN27_3096 [Candidatus Eremiobacteraeota bacterium]|nr:hypothetical protein [Candidatus Eremiobacteraeota bacterium]